MTKFVVNDKRTVEFVAKENGITDGQIHSSIGLERDGEIVAGIVYCDFSGSNIFLHVASKPGVNWISRGLLKLVFGWPFKGLGVKRITGLVPEHNARAVKLDEHLGFKREARLEDIFPEGALLVFRMRREECRFI